MRSEIIQREIDMLKKEHSEALAARNMQKARQVMKKIDQKGVEWRKAVGEERIQRAVENGLFDRLNRLISAAQILNSVTNSLVEEASDILKDNGLLVDGIADENRLYLKAADRYFKEFGKLVDGDAHKMAMFKDLDYFEDWFRKWAKLKPRPKEPPMLRGCLKEARKQNGTCYGQNCSMPSRGHDGQRWNAWMHLVSTSLPELKKFVPMKYRKHLNKKRK